MLHRLRCPRRIAIDDRAWSKRGRAELPESQRWVAPPIVGSDDVTKPHVGMPHATVLVEEHGFSVGLEVNNTVIVAVTAIDLFFDHQPAAGLVDLAFVVVT